MCVRDWTPFFTSSWNLQVNELILEFLGQIIKKQEAFINFFKKWKTFLQTSPLLKVCVRDWTTFFISSWNLQQNEPNCNFVRQIIEKIQAFSRFLEKEWKNLIYKTSFIFWITRHLAKYENYAESCSTALKLLAYNCIHWGNNCTNFIYVF